MGRSLTLLLLHQNYQVHLINRGTNYWKNDTQNSNFITQNAIIHHMDRTKPQDFKQNLTKIIEDCENWFDFVIDFSCYDIEDMECVVPTLVSKVGVYVFIGSDSIYDVCDRRVRVAGRLVDEGMAVRPEEEELREEYASEESYGDEKLECEEWLRRFAEGKELKYYCYRLPDVIGPYENTGRLYGYYIWIKHSDVKRVQLDRVSQTRPLSFVYSLDLCDNILDVLRRTKSEPDLVDKIHGKSFNVCFSETPTLKELLEIMARNQETELKWKDPSGLADVFLPSTECGAISDDLARTLLGWKSSPLADALKETGDFFARAINWSGKERRKALKKLPKKLRKQIEDQYE